MRVISGLKRGHRLLGPKGKHSRPTEDKVKEAVFNILYPLKDEFVALDLFACTGSIGIEFLSRGAKHVYFSELNNENINLMKKNLENTKFTEKAKILRGNYLKNLDIIKENIDYVYIDPPYESNYYNKSLEYMTDSDYFTNAKFIVEIDKHMDFSESNNKLELIFQRSYGQKEISIYERKQIWK